MNDLRVSWRRLSRSPRWSGAVILILGCSLAGCVTAYSLINAVALRSVRAGAPDRLIAVTLQNVKTNRPAFFTEPAFKEIRAGAPFLAGLAMYTSSLYRVEARHRVVDVAGEGVTNDYFELMGVKPLVGRFWRPSEEVAAGSTPVAVISLRLFRTLFDGDVAALRQPLTVNSRPLTVVGVTDDDFAGLQLDSGADVFLPIALARSLAGDTSSVRATTLVAAMPPAAELVSTALQLRSLWSRLAPGHAQGDVVARVESARNGFSTLRRQWGTTFRTLLAIAMCLLAVGCVNVVGLSLARSIYRLNEFRVCIALGAGRAKVVMQNALEGLILSAGGVLIAAPLVWWATQELTQLLSTARVVPLLGGLTPDLSVVSLAIVVALAVGSMIGALPLLLLSPGLAEGRVLPSRSATRGAGWALRSVVSVQIGATVVLLVCAIMLAQTVSQLRVNQSQLSSGTVIFTSLARDTRNETQATWPYYRSLIDRLTLSSAIESVALASAFPGYAGFVGDLPLTDVSISPLTPQQSGVSAFVESISPGFLQTVGLSRLQGRDFEWTDDSSAPPVVMINQAAAEKLFPASAAVGRHVYIGSNAQNTVAMVVGVVADAPVVRLREPRLPVIFRSSLQDARAPQTPILLARVAPGFQGSTQEFVGVIEGLQRHFVRGLFTLNDWFDGALLQERLMASASTAVAGLAALLGIVGIYSVMSLTAGARQKEVAIRISVGASAAMILTLLMRQSLAIIVPGLVVGSTLAYAVAGVIESQLYGIDPSDPLPVLITSVAILAMGLLASLVPAKRTSKVDPMPVLRQD